MALNPAVQCADFICRLWIQIIILQPIAS
jgi:hypothetical protein